MSTPPDAETGTIPHETPEAARFPWPPAEGASVVDGLVDTWQGVVLRPGTFFRRMPADLPFAPALLYYLVIGILGAAIQLFWGTVLPRPEASLLSELLGSALGVSPLVDFLFSPLYLLLSLLLAAGVTHLLVLALVPAQRGLGTTARVFCFAYSPVLFGVVPYAGAFAAFFWMTALSIVGVREAHGTSTARAATAVLLPLAGALLLLLAAYALMARAELLLGR